MHLGNLLEPHPGFRRKGAAASMIKNLSISLDLACAAPHERQHLRRRLPVCPPLAVNLDLKFQRIALPILALQLRCEIGVALHVGRADWRSLRLRWWPVDAFRRLDELSMEPLAVRVQWVALLLQTMLHPQESVIVGVIAPALAISERGPLEI